ncbi:hypothetical protein QKC54_gp0925 [Megavirus baoshan]|uniref:Uncharacterized protein n=1 Tax=Megavirus baoshan TaxID=2496520 RepID=A0A3S5HLC8_9VIRU|nr:hypothetical protein QKC54_gp0925 [Megavirus baoshan]AZL89600.1 hypothetical protein Mb0147 [Megavirus baoshan]
MSRIEIYYYQRKNTECEIYSFIHSTKHYIKIFSYDTNEKLFGQHIIEHLDDVFEKFNNYHNPLNKKELQKKVKKYHTHTSMSVDDIIKIDDSYFLVTDFGFDVIDLNKITY